MLTNTKNIYIDVETTGLPGLDFRPQIIQLAGIIEINGVVRDRFTIEARPSYDHVIQPDALEVTGLTELEIRSRPLGQRELKARFENWMAKHVQKFNKRDKYWFLAYNAPFDYQRLHDLWSLCGDKYLGSWLWYPPIDIAQIAGLHAAKNLTRADFPNFRLETVCKAHGIDLSQAHDALADIQATYELFRHLVNIHNG